MTSTSSYTNVDFFSDLGKLPPEVITLIIDNIPKCMLPQLLYFPPIRKAVASSILSNVNITIPEEVGRHEWVMNQVLVIPDVNATCSTLNSVILRRA